MTLMTYPTVTPIQKEKPMSLSEALALRDQVVWGEMEGVTLTQVKNTWLNSLSNPITKKNYRCAFEKIFEHGIINPFLTLQEFALISHNSVITAIKHMHGLSECTKQARAAAYISFTRYLSHNLDGNFTRAIPCKEGTLDTGKTFQKVHVLVKTEAMTPIQWNAFLVELHKINPRDCLIAKLALQGAKRINEVLLLTVEQINFDNGEINFIQLKTKGVSKSTIITFPASIMSELKDYIGKRKEKDLVFITRTGRGVVAPQVQNTFAKAGITAKIPFKVHPHVLRTSAITEYKRLGYSDSDISKISGHADLEMLIAYDKSSRAENATKKVNLVA